MTEGKAARIDYTVRSISVGTFEEPGPAVFWQSRFEDWIRLRLQLVIIQGGASRHWSTPRYRTTSRNCTPSSRGR